MKRFTILLVLVMSFSGLVSVSLSGQTIPKPELLFYQFDGSGTKIPNMALTPPAGTDTADIMGTVNQGNVGQCGGALIGSGIASSTDYVNTYWAPNLGDTSWTLSFWTSNIQPSGTLFYIFGDANSGSFRCFTNGVAGAGNWILRGPVTDVLVNGAATVEPSMTTFVYDSTANEIRAYLNGVLVNTVAQSTLNFVGPGPFKVSGYSSNVGLPEGGLMDEFRFYKRALDAAEIMQLYKRENTVNLNVTVCDSSYISPSAKYTWDTSGVYTDTLTNIYCGDSIITVNLTINKSTSSTIDVSACNSYLSPSGKYTWTISDTYADTIPNSKGCDSVITINLTINSVNTDVSLDGYTLTAVAEGAEYQWIDCSSSLLINGETNGNFTAASSGNYAVIVTDNGCTDTSECNTITISSIKENMFSQEISIFPNPTSGTLNIKLNKAYNETKLTILNNLGQVIVEKTFTQKSLLSMDFVAEPGVYYLKIVNSDGDTAFLNIIKE